MSVPTINTADSVNRLDMNSNHLVTVSAQDRSRAISESLIDQIQPHLLKIGLSKEKLEAARSRLSAFTLVLREKLSAKLVAASAQRIPSWNAAILRPQRQALNSSGRMFLMMFGLFFSCFCWLYLLYRMQHKDAASPATSTSTAQSASQFGQTAPVTATSHPSQQKFDAANPEARMFGAPRNILSNAASQAASDNSPYLQFSQPAAYNPFGKAANSFGAPTTTSPVQVLAPATFDDTAALVAPLTLRHAVGAPIAYGSTASKGGRQRTVVSR